MNQQAVSSRATVVNGDDDDDVDNSAGLMDLDDGSEDDEGFIYIFRDGRVRKYMKCDNQWQDLLNLTTSEEIERLKRQAYYRFNDRFIRYWNSLETSPANR